MLKMLCVTVAGDDYRLPSSVEVIFFGDGAVMNGDSMCISVSLVDDDIYEEDESFSASLTAATPDSATRITRAGSVTKTIQDNNGLSPKI